MNRALTVLALLSAAPAFADEGMWLYDDFPAAKTQAKYGFTPTQAWLDKVRLSSVRLARGCSASFASATGLVLTNHHCAHGCIQLLSTPASDLVTRGFYAKSLADERQCPGAEANQLLSTTNVTARIQKAIAGLEDKAMNDARKAEIAKIEKECATSDELRCDVVTLYGGGRYDLYQYRRFQDVRLVFAPEHAIASFGGDPDNFDFPRFDLDMALLRVYDKGKPLETTHFLPWKAEGAKAGDLVFTSGNPGRTRRLDTVAQLAYVRDVDLPRRLRLLGELRGLLSSYGARGKEQQRTSETLLGYVENSLKAFIGRQATLVDPAFFAAKVAEETALRAKIDADAAKKKKYAPAFTAIEGAMNVLREIGEEYEATEGSRGFMSESFGIAQQLVRIADEAEKPNPERLPEYGEARMPGVKQQILAPRPFYPEVEIETMTWSLTKLREALSPDHPLVIEALGKESPRQLATRLVKGTKLREVPARKALLEGGAKAIAASNDPMIVLAKRLDPALRAIRKRYEDQVEAVVRKNTELLGTARFEVLGTGSYPDATFSLRLSYGAVEGFTKRGAKVGPFTYVEGLYARATGADPFALPGSWIRAEKALSKTTPVNLTTTNDIIGGNSGSPLVDRDGALVGLIFDGNLPSLGGDFGYDGTNNRATAVDVRIMLEALDKVYDARRVVKELRP